MNKKRINLIQLFDPTQLVISPILVSRSSSTIIDQVYTSNPENITETFVPYNAISDHFPVCLSRKVTGKENLNLTISPPFIIVSRNLMKLCFVLLAFSVVLSILNLTGSHLMKILPHGTLFFHNAWTCTPPLNTNG